MIISKNDPGSSGGETSPKTKEKPVEKSLAERAESGERLTPNQLAEVTGNTVTIKPNLAFNGGDFSSVGFSALHQGAAQLHGWSAHEYHESEPYVLTIKDYRAALEAAGNGSSSHEPACSKCRPEAHKSTPKGDK